jgi:hypothetical protein
MKTLDELDALYAETTAGPWHVEHTGERGADVYSGSDPWGPDCGVGVVHASGMTAHADAAWLAAMHAAWPEVRERLRRKDNGVDPADVIDMLLFMGQERAADLVRSSFVAEVTPRAALTEEPPR